MKGLCDSNGVSFLQMRSVGSHSTSGRENEGRKGEGRKDKREKERREKERRNIGSIADVGYYDLMIKLL